ncbi:MAG: tetratricopeptide repeat protein [Treponema sp.]|nr:tetratricopeptide repeat protein [Treponema sp.]
MKKIVLFVFISFYLLSGIYSQTSGERAFKSNKPGEAISLLEAEIASGNVSSDSYNYLGLAYFQTGDFDKAIDAFERGMKDGRAGKKLLYFNEGNVCFAKGDFSKAESCFSFVLAASPDYAPALLNRANCRLKMQKYPDCIEDYKKYLLISPDSPQRDAISQLISYLEEEVKIQEIEAERIKEEEKRLEEENLRLQEELARQEEERAMLEAEKKAAEEERRRKLLEDVANSLQQTDSTSMTAGAEEVLDYEYESELE